MLSIVIPCYNEEENLPRLVDVLNKLVQKTNHSLEIILVNNGSTDNSEMVMKSLLQGQAIIRSILVSKNLGYGYGLIQGFNDAKGEILACTHADMQTDPMAIIEAYEKYSTLSISHPHLLVKGKRINRPFVEKVFTLLMQTYANIKLQTRLSDISAQPKVFSKVFWDEIASGAPYDFGLDAYLLMMIQRNKGFIETIDVDYALRTHGVASGGSGSWKSRIRLCKRMINTINELSTKNLGEK